jgi:hypothetical protein
MRITLLVIAFVFGLTAPSAAQQGKPMNLAGVTAKMTVRQAQAAGLVRDCRVQDWDKTLTLCLWDWPGGRPGSLAFKHEQIEDGRFEFSDTSANRASIVSEQSRRAISRIISLGARECPVTKPEAPSRFVTLIEQKRWCFADASISAIDKEVMVFGVRRRVHEFYVQVDDRITASARPVAVVGPIEKEISSAIVGEAVSILPSVRRDESLVDSFWQSDVFFGDIWFTSIDIYNRSCAPSGRDRFVCSFDMVFRSTPQGILNSSLMRAMFPEQKPIRKSYRDYVVEKKGGVWRSPTARSHYEQQLAEAQATAARTASTVDYKSKWEAEAREQKRKQCLSDAWINQEMAFCF